VHERPEDDHVIGRNMWPCLVMSNTISLVDDINTYFIINITYLLTPWSRVLLEKLTGSADNQEIPRIFGTRRFINNKY